MNVSYKNAQSWFRDLTDLYSAEIFHSTNSDEKGNFFYALKNNQCIGEFDCETNQGFIHEKALRKNEYRNKYSGEVYDNKMFGFWMEQIDKMLLDEFANTSYDMMDFNWRDLFDEDFEPAEAFIAYRNYLM